MSEIKRVYIGLPEHLADRVFWPAREFRTNPLSHIEGGVDVVVELVDGRVFGYDWIKCASAYISHLPVKPIDIVNIFARMCTTDTPQDDVPFERVWSANNSPTGLMAALEDFDDRMGLRKKRKHWLEEESEPWIDPMECGQYLPASEWRAILGEDYVPY